MKSLKKRIIASLLCVAVTAVNVNVCGVTAVDGGNIAATGSGRGITPSVAATPKSASTTTGSAIFEERSPSTLGDSSDDVAIKKADPYGTADNNGEGEKWATLAVVPEVCTMYDYEGHIVDYKDGDLSCDSKTLNKGAYMQVSAGLNLGSGKNDAIARLSYDVSTIDNKKEGTLYLEVCDPINAGWKTDGSFHITYSGFYNNGPLTPRVIENHSLTDVITGAAGSLYMSQYTDKFKISCFDSLVEVNQNVRGQYLSVATGDFDGDGIDSIIAYIPDFSNPKIREYECRKESMTAFNTTINRVNWNFRSNEYYYQPTQIRDVSSNVYRDFSLTKTADTSSYYDKTRNVPIVDVVAADVDRDGRDELIVTAGLGHTSKSNGCDTVMKIYDFVEGKFSETYSVNLKSDNYNNQKGRLRWASSAVGNVQTGGANALGTDFPEIVTAGWVDINTGSGIDMKHRLGVHITELVNLTEQEDGSYVGDYNQRMVLGTSDQNLNSNNPDGVSVYMKNGFPRDWTRHDKLAVGTLAYKGLESQSAIMLGDTVYDITSEGKLSGAYWGGEDLKKVSDHTRYSVRKLVTGNLKIAKDLAGESVCFLCADINNTYSAYVYYYKDGKWYTSGKGATQYCDVNPGNSDDSAVVDICAVDVDNDSLYVKLKDVIKSWEDPKPLYVLEAAPYFSEFPNSKGSTGVGYGYESGYEVSWGATISTCVESYFSQDITFVIKLGSWSAGACVDTSLKYNGSFTSTKSVELKRTNNSDENAVVVERTPVYIYRYDVLGYDGKDTVPAAVVVTGDPETAMISVDEYNSLAETYNQSHDDKLTLIDDSFGLGTPGNPLTYRRSFPNGKSNELFTMNGSTPVAYYGATGSSEKTISKSSTLSNGYEVSLTHTAYAGGDMLGFGLKLSLSLGVSQGTSFFHTDSIANSGSIGRQNEDGRFDFNWDMARWLNKGIPVVGYKVETKNEDIINLPPVAPNELTVTDTANESATLKWTNPPTTNGRITANKIHVYYREKFSNADYTDETVNFRGTEGEKTWSLTGLKRDTTYQCYIVNSYESGNDIRPSIRTSNIIEFTTANNPENVDVSVNHGKGVVLRSDSGKELQSVDKGQNTSIKDVLYNVNKGYHAQDYFYIASNGITATTLGSADNIIKVSGTPTDNTTITIPDMELSNYTINYNNTHDITLNNAVYNYTIESDTITLPTLVDDGYIFDGWLDQGNAITSIPSGSTDNKTLTAKWLDLSKLGYTATYPADGSEEFPYLIGSVPSWNAFCDFLENDKFDNFNGKHFKLVNSITVSTVAGSEAHKFGGIFDGNGKTLTFNCDAANSDYTAPFAYVQGTEDSHVMFKKLRVITTITSNNHQYTAGLIASQNGYTDIENCTAEVDLNTATGTHTRSNLYSAGLVGKSEGTLNIKDCTVTGTITTNGKYAGGFVGTTRSNLTIKNSVSGVTINSSISDDGTHGGFIGIAENCNKFDIEGCLFNGNLMGSSTYGWGGFVGWNATYTRSSIKNSLFAPQSIDLNDSQNENFAHNGITLANCYYMTLLGGTQGKQTHTITAGENVTIAYDGTPTTYNVSNIKAYGMGIDYDGTFYAGEGDDVPLLLGYGIPAETGYHFKGYDTNSGTLSESILTMPNSDVLITGGNVANTYSVHFDPNISFYYNGNEAEVEMEDQFFTYDEQAKALSKNRYHVANAEWLNWNTKADGSGITYADEQQIQNLTTQNNETVTFYAQWLEPNRLMYDSKIFKCYVDTTYSVYWVYAGKTVHVDIIDDKSVYTDIIITGEDGSSITFDTTTNTFTMPDQGISINAVGKKKIEYTRIYLDEYEYWKDAAYFYDENNPQVTPSIKVLDNYDDYGNGDVLVEDEDYTLSIERNTGNPNRVVTATVTIMGIGNYIGTNTTNFRITPFDIAKCQIDGIFEVYDDGYGPYNVLEESLKVWDGDTLLEVCHEHEDGSGYYGDYDLEIEIPENGNIYSYVAEHPYKATITGRGKWGGTKTFTFTVKELYHTIVFDANGGTGHMENDAALRSRFYNYPECTFTAPEGKKFASWEISSYDSIWGPENIDEFLGFTAPIAYIESDLGTINLKAKWRDKYQYTITLPDSLEFASDNVTAEGVAYEDEIVALRVKEGYTVNGVQAYLENLTEEDGVYKFRVTDNTVITTYTPVVINYVDVNGFTTPTTVYKEIYTDNDYKLPSTPYLDGYTFTGWIVNATAYNVSEGKTANDVKAAVDDLVEAVTDVTIAIVYTKKDGTHTVSLLSAIGCTLKNADGEEITDGQCHVSEQLYAVADQAAPEQKFSHWERTCANGSLVIAGYEKTYAFRMPDEDVTLSAVYVDSDEEVNKVGTGYIESVKRTADNKLSFIAILCVPDDCQMMKAGVVVESTDNLYDSWNDKYEELTTENARLIKYSDTSKNHYSSYKYTWTMSTSNYEKRWTVRPYLEYTDKNSNKQTIYGEAVSKCVNDVDYNNT